ncbi:MAG: N-acetyltransferase family protein [Candidatus Korobacteraceae bacterium]|jgi:phosphinothricin acetyltransferase
MSGIVVRAAAEEDLGEITRIYGHYVLNTCASFEMEAPDREEMARRHAGVLGLGLPYLAAEEDGRVVGYAYANAYRPRAAYRFTVEDSIYVDAAALGRGCGEALLAALIERCEQGPWRQMIAVIGESGSAASVRLHEKFGFREVGRLRAVGNKFDRWVDSILMQRALGG